MKLLFTASFGMLTAAFSYGDSLLLDASNFNVLVGKNFTGQNSDVEGRVAVGGNFNVTNYGIASALGSFSGDSLIVGGEFNYNNGQVFQGSVLTGDTTPSTPGMTIQHGTMKSGTTPSIYFPTLMTELIARSGYVGSLASNGATSFSFGNLSLSGGTGATRIFDVTSAQLGATNSFSINAPAGTTAVVNISGSSAIFQNSGFSLSGGITSDKVILNFWDAKTLSISSAGVFGTVFAPQADVTFNNGQINGQLVAQSFNGTGEMHISQFTGTVPVPEPASFAALALGGLCLLRRRRV